MGSSMQQWFGYRCSTKNTFLHVTMQPEHTEDKMRRYQSEPCLARLDSYLTNDDADNQSAPASEPPLHHGAFDTPPHTSRSEAEWLVQPAHQTKEVDPLEDAATQSVISIDTTAGGGSCFSDELSLTPVANDEEGGPHEPKAQLERAEQRPRKIFRPCRAKRDRYRKHYQALLEQATADPASFDFEAVEHPSYVTSNPWLLEKLKKRVASNVSFSVQSKTSPSSGGALSNTEQCLGYQCCTTKNTFIHFAVQPEQTELKPRCCFPEPRLSHQDLHLADGNADTKPALAAEPSLQHGPLQHVKEVAHLVQPSCQMEDMEPFEETLGHPGPSAHNVLEEWTQPRPSKTSKASVRPSKVKRDRYRKHSAALLAQATADPASFDFEAVEQPKFLKENPWLLDKLRKRVATNIQAPTGPSAKGLGREQTHFQ